LRLLADKLKKFHSYINMSTSTSGSGGQQPPPGNQGASKDTGHRFSLSIAPSGNGLSPSTAAWSPALFTTSSITETYVVDGVGLSPRFRRTTLAEARSAAQMGYAVLNGQTYQVIQQLPAGPMVNPSMPVATGIQQHIGEVVNAENALATGIGQASEQYNAAQVHRK
jgi:hypothetical protein